MAEPDHLVQRASRRPCRHLAAAARGGEAVTARPGTPGRRAARTAETKPARAPAGHGEEPGPTELRAPFTREELKRASVWFGLALAILAIISLAHPLLLIFAGIVLASMLDGGTRLLGRWLPIRRGLRLALVTLLAVAFVVWTFYYAGATLVGQAEILRIAVTNQVNRILAWANGVGLVQGGVQLDQLS